MVLSSPGEAGPPSLGSAGLDATLLDAAEPGMDEKVIHRVVYLRTLSKVVDRSWSHKLAAAVGWHLGTTGTTDTSNEIRTFKYTLITFLPRNLFEQFTRVANMYFLLITVLQLIPGLSPTSWFTTVFPLVVVLLVNAVKEGFDDYHRHLNDHDMNNKLVLVLTQGGKETPTPWMDVLCGDVVKVQQDEEVPADLVFLSSSDEENICHVETANLDGETNLKIKQAFAGTRGIQTADQLVGFEDGQAVHCELPNPRLYTFDGAVIDCHDTNQLQEPLGVDNLLLRGCTLRKTTWVVGLVVFTGADSKIMMNRVPGRRKVTQLERHMNVLVIIMFSIMLFLSCMLAAGDQIFNNLNKGLWYLDYQDSWPDMGPGFAGWFIQLLRFLILINGIIPISLYVTLEMVKVLQCVWMLSSDRKMYHAESDTPFSCRTTNLNEDLGQVQYVLSDKTGTLTQNIMGFVWVSVSGVMYGKPPPAVAHATEEAAAAAAALAAAFKPPAHIPAKTAHTLLMDPELHVKLGAPFAALATGTPGRPSLSPAAAGNTAPPDPDMAAFFTLLAVCNTVVPQVLEDGRHVYQAASPDEEALVEGAAFAGYVLTARSNDMVELIVNGKRLVYKVLAVLEFNSDRKRMSIICRCPDGVVRLFCKGADTMIMARVKVNGPHVLTARDHLEEMARAGYRTLCVAQKELTEAAWKTWQEQYGVASVALEGRDDKLAAAAERIERDMELLGATAVEDKLQDGVPEAIEQLCDAGIKVWVLTGDKVETAISIAFSCRLFTEDMALIEVRERDFDRVIAGPAALRGSRSNIFQPVGVPQEEGERGEELAVVQRKVWQHKLDEVEAENIRIEFERQHEGGGNVPNRFALRRGNKDASDNSSYVGVVIEGGALSVGLQPENQDLLVQLCKSCRTVVCCRVTPMQKAAVTRLVQIKCNGITLGIGDGANDVGMIQAAHIGVGISGREGRAAVLASDYSFAQFKYVARLILVHGRAMYLRNTDVVKYSFYKNFLNSLTYVYFAFVTAFSCQPLYTTGLIASLNVAWASLPIIAYSLTEQDVSQATIMAYPLLYGDSMLDTRRMFLLSQLQWIGLAVWHSLVVWFVPTYSMWLPNSQGRTENWVMVGCTVYMSTVIVINLRMAMMTRYWTWINHLLIWLSVLLFLPFLWLYGLVWPVAQIDGTADMGNIATVLFASPNFWLAGVLLAPALCILLDISIMSIRRHLTPKPHEILQEVEYLEGVRRQALRELGVGKHELKGRTYKHRSVEMSASTSTPIA